MSDTPQVLALGLCVIDRQVRVSQLPAPGVHPRIFSDTALSGGMAANYAVALARLGVSCGVLASVGDDAYGQQLRDELVADHVDIQGIVAHANTGTSYWMMFVNPEGIYQAILFHRDTCNELYPQHIKVERLRQARVFFTDFYAPKAAIYAARAAHAAGVTVVADLQAPVATYANFGISAADIWDIIEQTDLFMPSVRGLLSLTGAQNYREGLQQLTRRFPHMTIVQTLAEEGSVICRGDEWLTIPIFPVKVVDALGAGDTYHANLTYGLCLQGWDWARAGRWASAAAAIKCTRVGARGAPTKAEIEMFLQAQDAAQTKG